MPLNALILAVVVLVASLLVWPRVANAVLWRATITPLSSIIGSGFFVLGPVLDVNYGGFAPLVMLALCAMAYLFGGAIRYNIAATESASAPSVVFDRLESAASAVLAFAFVVSVAYYLNLFGAFGVRLSALDDRYHAKLLTTAVFLFILVIGWTRGFRALERLEQIAVGLKLAIIAGLVMGLAVHFGDTVRIGALRFDPVRIDSWAAVTLAAGLLVTVQGFETSRYLGATYDAVVRIRSMRLAQGIATAIYGVYLVLLTYAVETDAGTLSETSIIDMMQVVAPILPTLLIVAALGAQFSAAIADTAGSGGLIEELTKGRIPSRPAYALLVGVGLALTWSANIFEIISYASRAFAANYAFQSVIATLHARARGDTACAVGFAALAAVGAAIAVFGTPVEG